MCERRRIHHCLTRCRTERLARNNRRAHQRDHWTMPGPRVRCPVETMAIITETEAHAWHALKDLLWQCKRAHAGHTPAFAGRVAPCSGRICTVGVDVEYSQQYRGKPPAPAVLQLAIQEFVLVIPLRVLKRCHQKGATQPTGRAVMVRGKLPMCTTECQSPLR